MKSRERELYKKILIIALPIAMQNFMQSALNMLDVFMVGKLGDDAIAAVGSANQLFFLMVLLMFGINSGANVFTAQYWGKGDIASIKKVFGIALILSVAGSVLFAALSFFMAEEVIAIFRKESSVIKLGAEYLRVVSISYIFTAASFSVAVILRSMGKNSMPMVTSIISFFLNGILNYIFIFGKFGFPAMGVTGAALATTIARVVEFIITFGVIYLWKYEIAGKLRELIDFNFNYLKEFIKVSLPVIINEVMWAGGMVAYFYIYSKISKSAAAAVTIEGSIERMALVIFIGTASAAGAIIGNTIGYGEKERAYEYGKKIVKLGTVLAVAVGLLVCISSSYILSFYNVSAEVKRDALHLTWAFALYLPIKIFNLHNVIGILRSGGDTKYALFLDITGMWIISIPLGLFCAFFTELSVVTIFLIMNSEEIFKFILGMIRFRSKKWINEL